MSVVVADLYMEDLEDKSMDTAPPEMKPKMWKRYIDDSFEIIKRNQGDLFTDHLNSIDVTGSIRFMDELELEGRIPFLDTLVIRLMVP